MRLWLDDVRPMPVGFDCWAKTSGEAIIKIASSCPVNDVTHISFDHDLGENAGTGYDVAKYIEELACYRMFHPITWEIHSANPVGRRNIEQAMKSAERFWSA